MNPLENFADKWQEHPQREQNFYRWLRQVQQDLDKALELADIPGVAESLEPCLGERVVNEAVRSLPESQNRYTPPELRVTPTKPHAW